jgi:hypothetical protein
MAVVNRRILWAGHDEPKGSRFLKTPGFPPLAYRQVRRREGIASLTQQTCVRNAHSSCLNAASPITPTVCNFCGYLAIRGGAFCAWAGR